MGERINAYISSISMGVSAYMYARKHLRIMINGSWLLLIYNFRLVSKSQWGTEPEQSYYIDDMQLHGVVHGLEKERMS